MAPRILIVEDEEPLVRLLRYNLQAEGYVVDSAGNGEEAEFKLAEEVPDLVVLDWMIPNVSGIELCRRLRANPDTAKLPIIMLTARGEETERVRGLATGADDYIVKPFSVRELLARIRALLRRKSPERIVPTLRAGDIELDRMRCRVFRSGRVLSQTGGHGDIHPASNEPHLCAGEIVSTAFAHVADGPDAVRRAVREELKGGAHQIKVMAGGGVATPSDPIDMVQYTAEEIRAAVTEAASRRTYAFAHAYVPDAIIQAAEAGVRSIEHGHLLDERAAAVMAEHGTFLVPTLVVYEQIAALGRQWGFPEAGLAKLDQVQAAGRRAIRIALDAGVRVGFGTDLLGETHPAQSRELLLRAEVQSPLDVLRSATLVNADLLGRSGELGVVAPGAYGDLLLVEGNPLEDLETLVRADETFRMVVRNGDVVLDRLDT